MLAGRRRAQAPDASGPCAPRSRRDMPSMGIKKRECPPEGQNQASSPSASAVRAHRQRPLRWVPTGPFPSERSEEDVHGRPDQPIHNAGAGRDAPATPPPPEPAACRRRPPDRRRRPTPPPDRRPPLPHRRRRSLPGARHRPITAARVADLRRDHPARRAVVLRHAGRSAWTCRTSTGASSGRSS